MILIPGSYVKHAKMLDLGSGEVMSAEEGKIRIRFASGERSFLYERVVEHLTVTTEAVPAPAAKPKKASSKKKAKA